MPQTPGVPTRAELATLLRVAADWTGTAPAKTGGAAYLRAATVSELLAAADALEAVPESRHYGHFGDNPLLHSPSREPVDEAAMVERAAQCTFCIGSGERNGSDTNQPARKARFRAAGLTGEGR